MILCTLIPLYMQAFGMWLLIDCFMIPWPFKVAVDAYLGIIGTA